MAGNSNSVFDFFKNLDRRWIFLAMFLATAIPILLQLKFPETETPLTRATFNAIEQLPDGSKILLAFDYDPASEGELGPMATAFTRHCCEKKHKMYFLALWPVGPQMIDDTINKVITADFPDLVYGEDYVNLGFKPGSEGVIKVIVSDLRQLYTTDDKGTNIDNIPMCKAIKSLRDFDLIVNVSAGYPGTKEWVQYAATPHKIKIVAGCTGVQAPLFYPYIPEQLPGLLGAIKGAAEYEHLLLHTIRVKAVGGRWQVVLPSDATGGVFRLERMGQTTRSIAYDAPAGDVQNALAELDGLDSGGVNVTGGPGPVAPYEIEFNGSNSSAAKTALSADGSGLTVQAEGKYTEGLRRMGPQLVAHLLMVGLIVAGNVIYFLQQRRERPR